MPFQGEKERAETTGKPKRQSVAELLFTAGKMQDRPVPKRMSTSRHKLREASKRPPGKQRI